MNRRADRNHHRNRNRTSLRVSRPTVEGLEERKLLYAASGGSWTFPARVTYSFMPDGTYLDSSNNYPSDMQANFNAQDPGWQAAFQKAASIWQAVAGVNLVQVSDNGARSGSTGDQQGDPNFGDIRIGGFNMSADMGMNGTLAETFMPPPLNTGTIAGDIVFNDGQNWSPANGGYDMETVALHEFGHALGLDHSAISSAVMYAYYNGTKQTLTTDDTAGMQSIYGAWPAISNTYYTLGANITSSLDSNNQIAFSSEIPFEKNAWFYVTAPANTTPTMTVQVQTTGLSSLLPGFSVYTTTGVDQKPTGFGGYGQSSVFNSTISATINNVTPGETFAIRVGSSDYSGAYGSGGGYALLVNLGTQTQALVPPPDTTQATPAWPPSGGTSSAMSTGGDTIGSSQGPLGGPFGGLLGGPVDGPLAGLPGSFGGFLNGQFGNQSNGLFPDDPQNPQNDQGAQSGTALNDSQGIIQIGTTRGYGDLLTIAPTTTQPTTPAGSGSSSSTILVAPVFASFLGSNTAIAFPLTATDAAVDANWGSRPFDLFNKPGRHGSN